MGRAIAKLSVRKVAALSLPGYYSDGGNLYLQVAKGGTKSWVFRFTLNRRTHDMGLGSVDTFSLAEARERAREARQLLADGINPLEHRRAAMQARRAQVVRTFDECAAAYIAAHEHAWSNAKHAQQWRRTLETYASPILGKMPVQTIETAHVLRVLEPIWHMKTETASRLRGRMESVLDWAAVREYRKGDNPARWKGHLDALLPKPSRVQP